MIAAVGTDGTRPVVWGLGRSRKAALRDAAAQSDGTWTVGDLECHEITARQAAKVRRGSVAWPVRLSGPTQPESDRTTVQVLLRVAPPVATELRRRSAASGLSVSAVVSALVMATSEEIRT